MRHTRETNSIPEDHTLTKQPYLLPPLRLSGDITLVMSAGKTRQALWSLKAHTWHPSSSEGEAGLQVQGQLGLMV